jgi:hypothetical protein
MSANLAIVMKAAERMGMNLPAAQRTELVTNLFNSLASDDKMKCFNALVVADISLLDALMLTDNIESAKEIEPVLEEKTEVKESKPVTKTEVKESKPVTKTEVKESKPVTKTEVKESKPVAEEQTTDVKEEETSFVAVLKKNANKPAPASSKPVKKQQFAPRRSSSNSTRGGERVVARSLEEVRDLILEGKSICGYHGICNNQRCQWIHLEGSFLCLKYGNCRCKLAHLKDLPVPKAYHADAKYVVNTQDEYDDARDANYYHCTGNSYCFKACTFIHVAKGKQCPNAYCEDRNCDKVHVGVCKAIERTGKCENWNAGKCGFDHDIYVESE